MIQTASYLVSYLASNLISSMYKWHCDESWPNTTRWYKDSKTPRNLFTKFLLFLQFFTDLLSLDNNGTKQWQQA